MLNRGQSLITAEYHKPPLKEPQVIVFSMCREVVKAVEEGNVQVIEDMLRICNEKEDSAWRPKDPQELCNRIFCSAYMGTTNSSKDTRQ